MTKNTIRLRAATSALALVAFMTVASGLVYGSWNVSGEQALFVDDQERQATQFAAASDWNCPRSSAQARAAKANAVGDLRQSALAPHC